MSREDSTKPENIKIMLLKGQKGDKGDTYDDTEVWNAIHTQDGAIIDLTTLVNSFDGLAFMEDLAPVEDELNGESTHAYLTHQFIMHNAQFYRVIADIEIGDALVEGTNIQAVRVSEILEKIAEQVFKNLYEIINKTTQITKNTNGEITTIVETGDNATATSTFATEGTTTTITTTVVPTFGAYNFIKTTTIVDGTNTQTITENYTATVKS